jgi:hypothetical protein
MDETCAYCKHHTWHDTKETHVCIKDHEPKAFDHTCRGFKCTHRCGLDDKG